MTQIIFAALTTMLAGSVAQASAQDRALPVHRAQLLRQAIDHAVSLAAADMSVAGGRVRGQMPGAGLANGSWDELVRTIKPGQKVIVTLATSANVKGRLRAIDVHSISIDGPGGTRVIEVGEVVGVRYANVRKHHAVVGMLVGAAIGAVGLYAIDQRSSNPQPADAAAIGAVVIGMPCGALVGALWPVGPPLYQRQQRP